MTHHPASESPLAASLARALAGRYTLGERAGEGGMAIVYAAEDVRHRRPVAIKVLRPELAASLGGDRFLREIETAAGLRHPHILPVYDSGAESGVLYFVMPFVSGESLAARLERGPLPVDEAVRLAREVAGALGFAHARGVVHRDIKPDNILIEHGHAVVTDFGVARAVDAASGGIDGRLTATGFAVGTPAYMSPEQALGAERIDGRSDIYALGCVLFEMLTGERPFKGASPQSVIAQSVMAERPRVRSVRGDVPEALDAVVAKALAREPDDRFATAEELADALGAALSGVHPAGVPRTPSEAADGRGARRFPVMAVAGALFGVAAVAVGIWLARRAPEPGTAGPTAAAAGSVATGAQVIAVLPFATTGAAFAGVGEGMVDLFSTNLDGVGGIRTVDPRTVLHRWRERSDGGTRALELTEALEVGRDVRAGSVLVGSVVAVGPSARVTAELYSTDGRLLARAGTTGAADSVLALVDTLSLGLMREVWRARGPLPELRVREVTTSSLAAARAYLDGERHVRRGDWRAAAAAFRQAVAADSAFALAHLRLANAITWLEGFGTPNARQARDAGARFAARLSERDRALMVAERLYDERELAAFDSASALVARYPDDVDAWMLLGEMRYHAAPLLAPTPAAIVEPFERVLQLDPSLSPAMVHPIELAAALGDRAAYARWLERYRRAGAAPADVRKQELLGEAVWGGGDGTALGALLDSAPELLRSALAGTYVAPGASPGRAAAALRRYRAAHRPGDAQWWTAVSSEAQLLAGVGRVAEALALMDSTLALPGWGTATVAEVELAPLFAGLADTTAVAAALRVVRLPQTSASYRRYVEAELALRRRDAAAARRWIAEALADTTARPRSRALLSAVPGRAALIEGDTLGGVRRIQAGLGSAGFDLAGRLVGAPTRFDLALALARSGRGDLRADGIRRLRYAFDGDFVYLPLAQLALAEALEADGDRAGAAAAYARFARLWESADPALRERAERARAAAARLGGQR